MNYVSQQAVLEEAGLWHRELAEVPAGAADGTNQTFTVAHKPLADSDYDDELTADDVSAYVNGAPVAVVSVNPITGSVTLQTAPANDAAVTIDYAFTSIASDYVAAVIAEAQDWIDTELQSLVPTPFKTVPPVVRMIARVYAAGLLLAREYGLQPDEEANKQGERKIRLAERWLSAYRKRLEANGAAVGPLPVPRSSSAGRLFQQPDAEGRWSTLDDEHVRLHRRP